jgi:tol-pal system protein YbgF
VIVALPNLATPAGRFAKSLIFAAALALSFAAPAAAQNNQNAAQLAVQIQEMQEQMRLLTGQVEGLQFLVTQLQAQLATMTEDNEFRFQALEGGAPGKPQAATESQTPTRLPQTETPTATLDTPAPLEAPAGLEPLPSDSATALPGDGEPMELDLGDSQDPLVGNPNGAAALGAPLDLGSGPRPLDLSLDGGSVVSNGDANAQYQAGYDALVRGDYAFAQDQFSQFVALYPDDPQAPDATNWLGEAMIQQGAYDDAALVLAEGYQKYEADERAPDLLLRLGIALNGAQQPEVACRTYFTLEKRFPDMTASFKQALTEEKAKAKCPV